MKKTLVLISSVAFAALMAVSCGSKQAENAEGADSTAIDSIEEVVAEESVEVPAEATDNSEMLSKAKEAGLAKCNCYNAETKSVNADCINALLDGAYASYKNDQAFIDEMDKTYNECVKEKVEAAAKDAAQKGANAAAEAISKKLGK